ncbi:unnamed protein product [Urochloa humidicola]
MLKSLHVRITNALNRVTLVNLPESARTHGKQQVFLQTVSERPKAIQVKQHAFARADTQQLHCAAVVESTVRLIMTRHKITIKVVVLFPSISSSCCCYVFRLQSYVS